MRTSTCSRNQLQRSFAILFLSTAVSFSGHGQDPAITKPAPPPAMARDANPDWEVATVKASDPNDANGQHIDLRGRQIIFLDTTVEQFLLLGYGVQKSQLVGMPEWAKTERWNINGVPDTPGQPSWKQVQVLIQKVLAQRFALQLHHEQRDMPVFALSIAKAGPRLTPNTSDPFGLLNQQNGERNGQHIENLENASMSDLALILQFHVDRPVIDHTGLKGKYDFKLQWAANDAAEAAPDGPPGLFTAIQDQIGLKLERIKAPAAVLVIDKLTRPEAN